MTEGGRERRIGTKVSPVLKGGGPWNEGGDILFLFDSILEERGKQGLRIGLGKDLQ